MLKMCLRSVRRLALDYNINVVVIDEPKYGFGWERKYNYAIFEKFQAQDYVDLYDRILRIDVDILFNPKCPDPFREFPADKLWGMFEDTGIMMRSRRHEMALVQERLGKIDPPWKKGYFNSGLILASKQHRDLFKLSEKTLNNLKSLGLGRFREQNIINWRARKLGYDIGNMGYKWNHLHKFTKAGKDPQKSNVVHFAGKQAGKVQRMRELYKYWYG